MMNTLSGDQMGRINIVLDDDVERKLRVAIATSGGKKGDLSDSIEQAILEWLQKDDHETKKGKR
jgi:Arc/MetJ-type ribon-helix-helix transcriptional regulator